MLFAEVFSGASTLWFVTPWGLLITLPLYLGHALFFLNLAVITKRTSPHHLYFFGILFGLYEALITKVLWFGYPNSTESMFGLFQGIAWGEFATVVLFWHPIMSFLIPIFMYELLSGDIFPGHERYLTKNKTTLLVSMVLLIIGANFQSNGATYNPLISLGSVAGTLLIILLLHHGTKTKTLQDLVVGKKGMFILSVYLVLLYTIATPLLLPERLPTTILPYLLIILWYVLLIGLLWIDTPFTNVPVGRTQCYTSRDLYILALIFLILTAIFSLSPSISQPLIILFSFIMIITGGALFFLNIAIVLKNKTIHPQH